MRGKQLYWCSEPGLALQGRSPRMMPRRHAWQGVWRTVLQYQVRRGVWRTALQYQDQAWRGGWRTALQYQAWRRVCRTALQYQA